MKAFDVLRWILPCAAAFVLGAWLAWQWQGVRIDRVKVDHDTYVAAMKKQHNDDMEVAERARRKADEDYRSAVDDLQKQVDAGAVYRRCVAAGKCGAVIVRDNAGNAGVCAAQRSVPAAGRVDATSADAISADAGATADLGVANDCAVTTLRLNALQSAIEKQPGYQDTVPGE